MASNITINVSARSNTNSLFCNRIVLLGKVLAKSKNNVLIGVAKKRLLRIKNRLNEGLNGCNDK